MAFMLFIHAMDGSLLVEIQHALELGRLDPSWNHATCRCTGLPVEERMVALGRKQQRSEEYLAMNPLGKVPCLQV